MIYWSYISFNFFKKADKLNDNKMKAILKEINKVTFQVRKTLFSQYIEQCKIIHLVAFMQWRLFFFKSSCKGEEAERRK